MFILIDGIYIVLCLVYTHLSNLRKAFFFLLCLISLAFYLILPVRFSSVWFKSVRMREVNSILTLITWLGWWAEWILQIPTCSPARACTHTQTHTHTQKYRSVQYMKACFHKFVCLTLFNAVFAVRSSHRVGVSYRSNWGKECYIKLAACFHFLLPTRYLMFKCCYVLLLSLYLRLVIVNDRVISNRTWSCGGCASQKWGVRM
jgi:hypothetical protein